jgi:hypothetical protein
MKQARLRRFLFVALGLVLVAGLAAAQTPTGNLFGTVTDSGGQALPGVTVSLSGVGASKTHLTDAQGQFRFLGLDPGRYTLQVQLEGFGSLDYPGVDVSVGRTTTVPILLTPAVEETITVTSESPLLDERRLQQGTSVTQTELEKIPTARDPWAILSQTPGVVVDRTNVGGNESGQQSIFRAQGVEFNQNVFAMDGIEVTDMRATGRFEDTHVFSSNLFVTGTYSLGDFGFALAAKGGTGPSAPESWRRADGVWQDNFLSGAAIGPNDEIKADASYFFTTGTLNHELKVGGRFRTYESFSDFTWPGRNLFTFNTTSTSFVVAKRGVATPTTMEYMSLWAQDTVTFGKFTINAGLRFDDQAGINEAFNVPANPMVPNVLPALNFAGQSEEFDWVSIEPRLGLTYALGKNRDTLIRTSFSRFADQLGVGTVTRTNPAGEAYAYFVRPYSNTKYTGTGAEFNDPSEVASANGFDPSNPSSLVDPDVTDPGLDPPTTTELVFNVEHALLPEFVVGLSVTARTVEDITETRSFLRDPVTGAVRTINRNDYVADGALTGTLPGGLSGGPTLSYTVPVFALANDFDFTGGALLLNGSREREYLGAAVTFTKRLANRWMLRGFVNYGEDEWKVDDEYLRNTNPNRSTGGGDRDGDLFVERSTGSGKGERFLQSTWSTNLTGMYQVAPDRPWGFNLSASVQAREGYPIPYFDQIRTSDGSVRSIGVLSDLGDYRQDDIFTADVRLEKEFALTSAVNFTFGIDAFNVTNEGTDLSRIRDLASSRVFFLNDNVSPRIYRLGVRLGWK